RVPVLVWEEEVQSQPIVRLSAHVSYSYFHFTLADHVFEIACSLVTYLYETDGRYRKNFFIGGKETDDVEYGTCDVSSHFREMIQFGNYDSILPEEARRGLREG
ncbi:MAG: hypothetical protein CW342_10255, partial [Thermoactinomycetaceae bacterium]|nr:hypothetical protein [Thermoactinomycetaceae bacterium]